MMHHDKYPHCFFLFFFSYHKWIGIVRSLPFRLASASLIYTPFACLMSCKTFTTPLPFFTIDSKRWHKTLHVCLFFDLNYCYPDCFEKLSLPMNFLFTTSRLKIMIFPFFLQCSSYKNGSDREKVVSEEDCSRKWLSIPPFCFAFWQMKY